MIVLRKMGALACSILNGPRQTTSGAGLQRWAGRREGLHKEAGEMGDETGVWMSRH